MKSFALLVGTKFSTVHSFLIKFSHFVLSRASYRTSGIIFLILTFFAFEAVFPTGIVAFSAPHESFSLSANVATSTKSLFTEKIKVITQEIKFKTKYVPDPNLSPGEQKLVKEGKPGEKTLQTKITLHGDEEFSRQVEQLSQKDPSDEVIAVGSEKQDTSGSIGNLVYKKKLTVWATAYDPSCNGCTGQTSTGLRAGFGVIAVDPSVIPLGSKVFIPGYGTAVAGDTGSSIKGNKIDLGFDNISQSGWASHTIDIYLL